MLKIKSNSHSLVANTKHYKILVLGSSCSGKSVLCHRAVLGKTPESEYVPTLGMEMVIKHESSVAASYTAASAAAVETNEKTALEIWNGSGQARYRPIVMNHYDGVRGVLLVYDMTSEASFKELVYWYNECKRYVMCDCVGVCLCHFC